jgi:FkbH-like protein
MKLADIKREINRFGHQADAPTLSIGIISNVVVSQLAECIELALRRRGVRPTIRQSGFGALLDGASQFANHDVVLVFWDTLGLTPEFIARSSVLSADQFAELSTRVLGELATAWKELSAVPLVFSNSFSAGLVGKEPLSIRPVDAFCTDLTVAAREMAPPNVKWVDIDSLLMYLGRSASFSQRGFRRFSAPYSVDFLWRYALSIQTSVVALAGRVKKLAILDCDNTLWGGVIGEDLMAGIEIGNATPRGSVFRQVQYELLELKKRGVLLAIASKNNEADVWEVFDSHPEMVLSREDFVCAKIDWNDKPSNIKAIIQELNLGADSAVFVDDSSFEVEAVRSRLPDVMCLQVPKDHYDYPEVISELRGAFHIDEGSAEDETRTQKYSEERLRKQTAKAFASREEFLGSLGLQLTTQWNEEVPVRRASQLTQKTNQFNLTTKRYSESDMERLVKAPNWSIVGFSVRDRFGDYGIVALAIVEDAVDEPGSSRLDTLLMSCRVLGRDIEYAVFDLIMADLVRREKRSLSAEYIPTSKNGQLTNLLDILGMSPILDGLHYQASVEDYEPHSIPYIDILK